MIRTTKKDFVSVLEGEQDKVAAVQKIAASLKEQGVLIRTRRGMTKQGQKIYFKASFDPNFHDPNCSLWDAPLGRMAMSAITRHFPHARITGLNSQEVRIAEF